MEEMLYITIFEDGIIAVKRDLSDEDFSMASDGYLDILAVEASRIHIYDPARGSFYMMEPEE